MSSDQGVPPKRGLSPWVIIAIVVACAIPAMCCVIGVLVALLLPAIQAAREAARTTTCMSHLKEIGIALQSYNEQYKSFPPAFVPDAEGKPMHSWRVLVLPFLEDPAATLAYQQYDFNEPWNGPNNSKLAARMPEVFHCPSDPRLGNETGYAAVVGPQTAWPGSVGIRIAGLRDGMSNTILVVEAAEAGINWMEPRDLTYESAKQGIDRPGVADCISSHHPHGANVLFGDSAVYRLTTEEATPAKLDAWLTAAGGEEVRPPN